MTALQSAPTLAPRAPSEDLPPLARGLFGLSYWGVVSQADPRIVAHYLAHYSSKANRHKKTQYQRGISSAGETLTLLTFDSLAAFLWRKEIRDDGQAGINCALFRNTGPVLSSTLIQEADALAWSKWPGARLFTFVNPREIRSTNPGYCFVRAGWQRCGMSKSGLVILEILPSEETPGSGASAAPRASTHTTARGVTSAPGQNG